MFLLMTEIVYILLWSKHNIHGWTVFSYITTLLVTYLLLGISHFASSTLEQQSVQGRTKTWTFCGILGEFTFTCIHVTLNLHLLRKTWSFRCSLSFCIFMHFFLVNRSKLWSLLHVSYTSPYKKKREITLTWGEKVSFLLRICYHCSNINRLYRGIYGCYLQVSRQYTKQCTKHVSKYPTSKK